MRCSFRPKLDIHFLTKDSLSKTGILIKLTKNLVTIAISVWSRYLIEKNFMQTFTLS